MTPQDATAPLSCKLSIKTTCNVTTKEATDTMEPGGSCNALCSPSSSLWHTQKPKPPSLGDLAEREPTTTSHKRNRSTPSAGSSLQKAQEDMDLDAKCRRLAEVIRSAKHLVAFTGAGISTSVGLPDYRGENGIRQKRRKTKAKTNSNNNNNSIKNSSADSASYSPTSPFSMLQDCASDGIPDFNSLVPSQTHMALYELHRRGFLKYVVSQNVDNLHLKSGLPRQVLMEVHGNATQAKCETCEKIFTTDFPWTGLCDNANCPSTKRSVEQRLRARTRHGNGRLKRNVISFDEPLGDIDEAIDHAEVMDVALVLGTSLKVEPFAEMASEYAKHLIMVNLQPTTWKLDKMAEQTGVRLYEKCDVVMARVMKHLLGPQYEIPTWQGQHPTSVFTPEHEDKNLVNVLAGRVVGS